MFCGKIDAFVMNSLYIYYIYIYIYIEYTLIHALQLHMYINI